MEEKKEVKNIGELPHSCKIAINGKGVWSGEIKVYGGTPKQALEAAIYHAEELNEIFKHKNKVTK